MLQEADRLALAQFAGAGAPRLLFVTHAWGGGVEQHVTALSTLLGPRARVMVMRPAGSQHVEMQIGDGPRRRIACDNWQSLVEALRNLNFSRMHLHHVHGLPAGVLTLDLALGLPLDVTLHDYFTVCPQYQLVNAEGRYCGEPDAAGCSNCLSARPHAWNMSITEWREAFASVLQRAQRVFAPSASVADGVRRYVPALNAQILAHPERPFTLPTVVKVALLGALSPAKGLNVATDVAAYAVATRSPLVIRLIGHAAEPLPETITATGSYASDALGQLIATERPDVIWLPSQVPETYSFTLSAALATGLPIVASAIGALAGRLQGEPSATLLPHDSTARRWHDALLAAASAQTQAHHRISPERLGSASLPVETYGDIYLQGIASAVAAGDPAALLATIDAGWRDGDAAADDARPLLDIFRVGVYGGHRQSLQVVEHELQTLPPGETSVIGRSQFATVVTQLNAAETLVADLEDSATNLREALDAADVRAVSAREHIAFLERESAQFQRERDNLLASTSWKLTRPLRLVVRVVQRASRVAQVAFSLLRRAPALARGGMIRYRRAGWRSVLERLRLEFRPRPEAPVIELPAGPVDHIVPLAMMTAPEHPVISIVIPVYGQHETTFACLKSIAAHPPRQPYEIVVMDDCSPEPAALALAPVTGLRILRNERNLGFIGNVNAGVQAARGDWLVILNNDTVVRPGALDALIDTFTQHDNVGLVGAKLLNADGSLQEAGGIVWRDGSAWNWGRGQNRDDPRFNYVRDADYCSGAALAIRRDLFLSIGGFDSYYAPAYYEDTDLAFQVRARGLRVLYQPAAEIFHLEGVSHGRDETSGIKAHQVTNAGKFHERWKDTLANHRDNAVEPEQEAHRGTRSNILIVEACMITPDQDAGSVRMLNLLHILRRDGHHVTFVADNLDGDPRYANQLRAMGVEVLHAPFARNVRAVLRERGPTLDTIVLCRYYIATQYVHSIRSYAPKAKIVFDTVDLHFVREEREAAINGNPAMARSAAATRTRELAVIARSDITLVVSDFEQRLLASLLPGARVDIISTIQSPAVTNASADGRAGILFVGGFRHPPNVDAVKWYITEVLPHLRRRLPDAITTIVGSNMPDEIAALQRDGVLIRGFVEDTAPLLGAARVSIAPLRFGAGVKGKINEAMNHGIPVVATTCAVEGMKLRPGEDVLVADDAEAFAQAIADVYQDAALWNKLSAAGIANVQAHFSPEAATPAVRAVFGGLARPTA